MIKFNKERLTVLREMKGLTPAEFARQIGVSRQLVCGWEQGRYVPTTPMLAKIANTFEIAVSSFFTKECYQSEKQ